MYTNEKKVSPICFLYLKRYHRKNTTDLSERRKQQSLRRLLLIDFSYYASVDRLIVA